eukprot:2198309-Alexandrium_andersonii.AAC.1
MRSLAACALLPLRGRRGCGDRGMRRRWKRGRRWQPVLWRRQGHSGTPRVSPRAAALTPRAEQSA